MVATQDVHRPNRNSTYILIYLTPTNIIAWQTDAAGYLSDVPCNGNIVLFQMRNALWIPGATYYILFSSGTVSGQPFVFLVMLSVNMDGMFIIFTRLNKAFNPNK
jgi:archaellum component FlaF (FlaF/FlaG flagellin family)